MRINIGHGTESDSHTGVTRRIETVLGAKSNTKVKYDDVIMPQFTGVTGIARRGSPEKCFPIVEARSPSSIGS
jgi:hypothetical protein